MSEIVPKMEPKFKVCRQCGRKLDVEAFRQYPPRGTGTYRTSQGRYTICKQCESISNRAATALRTGNQEAIEKFRTYYTVLYKEKGLPPVTKPARLLLNYYKPGKPKTSTVDDLMTQVLGQPLDTFTDAAESETLPATTQEVLERHCRLVRERGYASFDEADAAHRKLTDELKAAGLYEEINNLMDEWFDEEE